MLIAHITDCHATAQGTLAMGRMDTNAALDAAITHINGLDPAPDMVIATGDLANDAQPGEYDTLVASFARLQPPLFVLPGNHDDRDLMRARLAAYGRWDHASPFLHYAIEDGPVRVIMLDTLDPGAPQGLLCPARLDWLATTLAAAPDRPTILAMHHPPVATGIGHMDRMRCFGAIDGLADLLRANPQVVRVLCGHLHRDTLIAWAGTTVQIAPSTAHQLHLAISDSAPAAWRREPPALLLHLWRPETGLISHRSVIGDYGPVEPYR